MLVKSKLKTSTVIMEVNVDEFAACLNYVTCNKDSFPYNIMPIIRQPVRLDDKTISGYNSLIKNGVFSINNEGYPVLSTKIPTITDFITCLDTLNTIVTVKLIIGKRFITFFYIRGTSFWTLFWRNSADSIMVASASNMVDVGTILLEIIKPQFNNLGGEHKTLKICYYDDYGEVKAETAIETDDNTRRIRMVENKPNMDSFITVGESYPKQYYSMLSLHNRISQLLSYEQ